MLGGAKLDWLEKYNYLANSARKGTDSFPDDLCNFLTYAYELGGAVLFQSSQDSSLFVDGTSSSAKKKFQKGMTYKCESCPLLFDNSNFSVNIDDNCKLLISDSLMYECCIKFKIEQSSQTYLLKLAKKAPFIPGDGDALKEIADFNIFLLSVWLNIRGGKPINPGLQINKILLDSTHELRTPTNTIVGFSSLLSEDNLSSSQAIYISTIRQNAQEILQILNDITELTKIEMGDYRQNIKTVNVRDFTNDIVDVFKRKYSSKINYFVQIDPRVSDEIQTDDQKLRYSFKNVLGAVSLFLDGGEISIKITSPTADKIQFVLSSVNLYLSNDDRRFLMEPFGIQKINRLKNSGLSGLTFILANYYLQILGGSLNIDSSPGHGIIFSITFKHQKTSSIEKMISQIPPPSVKNNILVIEDDFATSKLLSNYLAKWGYAPRIVNHYDQIFYALDNEDFLAVFLDIEIPNMNGLELLSKIKAHPKTKNTPVIVCSVEVEEQKAFMMGAVEYFVKPINYNYLVEVLTSYKLRKNSNVLCVDDDLPTLNLVRQAIDSAGFRAIAESISANVMNLIEGKDIDLAIIDLDMPHPNGFELIKLIKSEDRYKNLPIIIYTGKENYESDLQKVDGLFDYLLEKKSSNIEDLQDTIKLMINRYETPPPVEDVMKAKDVVKILFAEDYKHSQIIVTRLLKKAGFENVVVVENGEEAYNFAKKENFDIILMDMQMPIMNGFEATSKIREMNNYKDTPIIALTAFAMKGDREKCLEAGATDYIPKPIDSKEFIEKIKYYVSSR
ncbi:MAG: response regulator [bacterium]